MPELSAGSSLVHLQLVSNNKETLSVLMVGGQLSGSPGTVFASTRLNRDGVKQLRDVMDAWLGESSKQSGDDPAAPPDAGEA